MHTTTALSVLLLIMLSCTGGMMAHRHSSSYGRPDGFVGGFGGIRPYGGFGGVGPQGGYGAFGSRGGAGGFPFGPWGSGYPGGPSGFGLPSGHSGLPGYGGYGRPGGPFGFDMVDKQSELEGTSSSRRSSIAQTTQSWLPRPMHSSHGYPEITQE